MWIVSTLPAAEPIHRTEMKTFMRVDGTDDDALIDQLIIAARQYCEQYQNRAYVTQSITLTLDYFSTEIQLPRAPVRSITSIYYDATEDSNTLLASTVYDLNTNELPNEIKEAYGQIWPVTFDEDGVVRVIYITGYATPFTAAVTDDITVSGRTFANGEMVFVTNSGGALPTGLTAGVPYFVVETTGTVFELATAAGGAGVTISGVGSGTNFIHDSTVGQLPEGYRLAIKMLVAHWYEQRQPYSEIDFKEVPMCVNSLLLEGKVY